MKHDPAHRLEVAQIIIVSGFILFLSMVAFFLVDAGFTGRSVDTTAYILNSTPASCNITILQGYNLISIPCISTAEQINEVFGNNTKDNIVYQYVPDNLDSWRVYNPNLPSYVYSDLQYVSRRAGYIVLSSESYNRTINGTQAVYTNIPLAKGWNLVGYPSQDINATASVFLAINASFNEIRAYNASSGNYMIYTNPGGNLDYISPTYGYWINVSNATMWVVYP